MTRHLFQQPEPARRSLVASLIGLLADAAAVAGVIWFASAPATRVVLKHQEQLTFLHVMPRPVEMVESLRKVPPLEISAPKPPPVPETILEMPKPPQPAVPEPPPPLPTVPEPLVVKRPVVKVGEFAAAAPAPTPKVAERQVQAVGFESPPAVAPDIKTRAADQRGTIETSGFESAQTRSPSTKTRHAVADSGFGSVSAAPQPAVARQAVAPVGFSDSSPTPAAIVRQRTEERVTPAEVLFKPTPSYSVEARAQKIEGTVTLEVEFSATGHVRVLRVVRGLGHGLDEIAIRAAEQIRFKPAQSAGKPVDFTASVQIVFQLT